MARTGFAQVAQFNGVAIAGLQGVDIEKGHGRVAAGSLDGMQGSTVGTARGDQFVTGTVVHEDIEKMITLLTTVAAEATSDWYEKEAGEITYTKNMLKYPVFGTLNFSSGIGRKAQATHQIQCRFGAAETFEDVHSKLAGEAEPTRTVQVSAGDPIGFTFDPSGAEIAIAHLREFSFSLGGEFVTDSDPGAKGRTAVEFRLGLLTFSVSYRDADLDAGSDLADQLLARDAGALRIELEVKQGATANTFIELANANFIGGPRRATAGGYTEFTLTGQCDWTLGTTLYKLDGAEKMITITPATIP